MTLKFVPPPEEAKNLPRWASYVAGEGMKTHSSVGHAKLSFNNRGWTRILREDFKSDDPYWKKYKTVTKHAFILENVEGTWYVLYEIKPGLTSDELPWLKEFVVGSYRDVPYDDYAKTNEYWQNKIKDGTYRIEKRVVPMSRDEYVAWRLKVEHERLGIFA